jgi:hypothetical protein
MWMGKRHFMEAFIAQNGSFQDKILRVSIKRTIIFYITSKNPLY